MPGVQVAPELQATQLPRCRPDSGRRSFRRAPFPSPGRSRCRSGSCKSPPGRGRSACSCRRPCSCCTFRRYTPCCSHTRSHSRRSRFLRRRGPRRARRRPVRHAVGGVQVMPAVQLLQAAVAHLVVPARGPVRQVARLRADEDPVVHAVVVQLTVRPCRVPQAPPLQTLFVPHEVPFATFPVSAQTDIPVTHEVAPVRQRGRGRAGKPRPCKPRKSRCCTPCSSRTPSRWRGCSPCRSRRWRASRPTAPHDRDSPACRPCPPCRPCRLRRCTPCSFRRRCRWRRSPTRCRRRRPYRRPSSPFDTACR